MTGTGRTTAPNGNGLALFTDLYELTMLQAYFEEGLHAPAVFSLFVRRLPQRRNYLLACGLDTVLEQLEGLCFEPSDLDYLASLDRFSDRFLRWLEAFRFTGSVRAVPEGTPVFANEPILEVTAPLPEAQLIETLVMNQIHLQTVQASKAARLVTAAEGRQVVDFGARRMHGLDAAVKGARAFHVAGVTSTSNVLAGKAYGIPVSGTMAHSYIQAHHDESEAFAAFARLYPETVLLVDTYDTLEGVRRVIQLGHELGDDFRVNAVRLDSGDLGALARQARDLLDAAGLQQVRIFASGGLDEYAIGGLLAQEAPIDAFGVGTSMGISTDVPDLDIAYKLAEYAGEGRLKLSSGKPILPGAKQIFRRHQDGLFAGDIIGRQDENQPGEPLLQPVMREGQRLPAHTRDLDVLRNHTAHQLEQLPPSIRAIEPADTPYPVSVSPALQAHQDAVTRTVRARYAASGQAIHGGNAND
ncbi:nicotinate phosphoribosyltransferase [Thioalkalivibrio sp. AKL19]|uniref:nicotinate phosphoribosyltransferase n=1 Tax=Thioalkalivibrio sp. AKL19 TaxID=1266914 RepID=UPI00041A47DB|nr:nicotinate phosphoribosyltransferase [Thioalkalivibrio sp. AKL19]